MPSGRLGTAAPQTNDTFAEQRLQNIDEGLTVLHHTCILQCHWIQQALFSVHWLHVISNCVLEPKEMVSRQYPLSAVGST